MNKRALKYAIIATITAGVSFPLLKQATTAAQSPPAQVPTINLTPPAAPATQPAVDPAKVVVSAGDFKITAGDFNAFLADLDPATQSQVVSRPDGKRKLAEEMIKLRILSDEAKKQKVDQTPRVQIAYEEVLANALLTKMATDTAEDEKFFNEHKDYFDEIKARHILIAVTGSGVPGAKYTDAQAKAKADEIKKRLDKGEDFAAIARAESDDKASGVQGGNLGSVTRGAMVPPFEEAAFALKKGQTSDPVKTQFGYHIIQVLDRTPGTYEDAKQRIPMRRLDMLVEEMKKASKPQLDEGFFGADPSAQAAPAASVAQPASANVPAVK